MLIEKMIVLLIVGILSLTTLVGGSTAVNAAREVVDSRPPIEEMLEEGYFE